jgi:hypothetical protein
MIIKELLKTTDQLGLLNVSPEVLSDAGNLIVRLSPYPLVARIAKLFDGDSPTFWKNVLFQELKVAEHLIKHKVPVITFSTLLHPGPHKVGSTWMTLWEYVPLTTLPAIEGEKAIDMLNEMTRALYSYKRPLQTLGAWKNVVQGAEYLDKRNEKDERIQCLLEEYENINKVIKNVDLFPAHGDAHPNNLIPSPSGWKWIDFEDVSLMPKFWDFASFIGNITLFQGLKHPVVDYVLNLESVISDKKSFEFALKSRIVMSITTNLSLALDGNGDLDFGISQLNCLKDFLLLIKNGI